MDSPRIHLVRKLFELMETQSLTAALDELLAHCTDDVVFEPHMAHGKVLHGRDELRSFWEGFEGDGTQVRAGTYSVTEEGDSVVVSGWLRTIRDGRLADTQARWVYVFNDDDQVVSAGVERA